MSTESNRLALRVTLGRERQRDTYGTRENGAVTGRPGPDQGGRDVAPCDPLGQEQQ